MSHLSVPDFPAAGQASTAISLPAPSALASHSAQAQVAQASQVALTVQAAQASHEPPGVPRCKESPGTPRCKESPGAPRCAIYIRVSTSEQKIHGKSLAAQREYLLAYAAAHGFQVVGIYADEGKTARKELRRRKAVHALLADARDGNIDLILFWKMDRWFRNISDFYKVQEQLDACRVRWIAAAEPNISMDTREGRLNLNIMLSIGQNEVDTTSERIRFTVQHMVQNGRLIFGEGNMPFGYMARREGGEKRMVKNPAESPVAADIFRYFLSNPCKKDTLEHIRRVHGLSFSYTRLNTMLSSEFYKGTYRGHPYCPPYLSPEEWERLQTLSRRRPSRTGGSGRVYLFSGLIRCPSCGRPLSGTGCGPYCYYRCHAYPASCSFQGRISQAALEPAVLEAAVRLAEPAALCKALRPFPAVPGAGPDTGTCKGASPRKDTGTGKDTSAHAETGTGKDASAHADTGTGRDAQPQLLYSRLSPSQRKAFWHSCLQEIRLTPLGGFLGLIFQPHSGLTRQ